MLTVRRHPDVRSFLARAEPWLLEAEIERAGPLQSARQARVDDSRYQKPTYWATIEDGDKIIGCAYRTPPYRVGVTALPQAAFAPLVLDLEAVYRERVSGFSGVDPAASALADIWIARHGGSSSIVSRQFLFSLGAAEAAAGPAGALRAATQRDATLAKQWGDAAAAESRIALLDGNLCVRLIGMGQLHVFEDGAPRCLVGVSHSTPRAAALAIVYTPPAERRKGYALRAVAALREQLAERGVPKRYFFVDPGNRPAQAIAQRLGSELVHASVDIDFR
jgi:RimJ/RimL family protein N-acetyltransferase